MNPNLKFAQAEHRTRWNGYGSIPVWSFSDADLARKLEALLGPEAVLSGSAAGRAYDCDSYTVEKNNPGAVVLPRTTEEVAKVVRWCYQNDVPFTARGAGTGLSGGALPAMGGVIISTKKMAKILEIDLPNRCLLAQTGIANKKISDAVKDKGSTLPRTPPLNRFPRSGQHR